jgi:AcrR family transcriptional regulator
MPKETSGNAHTRLRPSEIQKRVLNVAYESVLRIGFRAVTVESVSAQTGIAKTSIYRRWPNKAAMVMDAFVFRIGPGIAFPPSDDHLGSIRKQMLALAKAFRGPAGTMIKALLGEAQFDAELAEAFRKHWLLPRRKIAVAAVEAAIDSGELRPDINVQETLDALYGGLYYRLLTGSGPLSDAYVECLFSHVVKGLGSGEPKTPVSRSVDITQRKRSR